MKEAIQQKPYRAYSPDYATVVWNGIEYHFTPSQAACVGVLIRAWEAGTPELHHETVAAIAEVNSPIRSIFRNHPAWGCVIVRGAKKGVLRIGDLPKCPSVQL